MAGNPLQAQTLNAGVTAAAGPAAAQKLDDAIDVYSATGRRLAVTPTDEVTAGLFMPKAAWDPTELGVGAHVAHEAAGPLGPIGVLGAKGLSMGASALNRVCTTMNAKALANMLMPEPAQTTAVFDRAQQFKADQNRPLSQLLINGVPAAAL